MIRARIERSRNDDAMTLTELVITMAVLFVLLGMVFVSMSLIDDVGTNVTSQYQEFDQALPALTPFHNLLAAEIEPGPNVAGAPTPGFASIGNFSLTFYANIGTAYANTVSCPSGSPDCAGSTAGPAKIVAKEVDSTGANDPSAPVATSCNARNPCNLQVWMFLPQPNPALGAGAPSCPLSWGGTVAAGAVCQYTDQDPTPAAGTYRLLANVQDVVNDPSAVDPVTSAPTQPIFTYSIFDPTYNQNISLTPFEMQQQTITGLGSLAATTAGDTSYPVDSLPLGSCAATSANAPTVAIACPLDAVQSIGIDVRIAKPGTDSSSSVDDNLTVYRYAQSPGSPTAPYQYSTTQG